MNTSLPSSPLPSPFRFAFLLDETGDSSPQAGDFVAAARDLAEEELVSIEPLFLAAATKTPQAQRRRFSLLRFLPAGMRDKARAAREIRARFAGSRGKLDGVLWTVGAAAAGAAPLAEAKAAAAAPVFLRLEPGAAAGVAALYREAFHLFPCSQYDARYLKRDGGVPADKITVVSPGVDTAFFRPAPAAKPDDGVVRFLFVDPDFTGSGGRLLLQWARLAGQARRANDTPFEVHIVTSETIPGDDTPRGVFVHQAVGKSGNKADLRALYQRCDVFVLPASGAGYPFAAVEAMASGLPIILSDTGSSVNSELVDDSVNGYLVEPNNPTDLFSALEKLLGCPHLRALMGSAGRVRACACFDRQTATETLLSVMMDTADRRRSQPRTLHINEIDEAARAFEANSFASARVSLPRA